MRTVEEQTARLGANIEATEGPVRGRDRNEGDMKLQRLANNDDVEAYLVTFERLMTVHEIPQNRWAYKLAPQLTGRTQQAYAAMPMEETGNYELVKTAIL